MKAGRLEAHLKVKHPNHVHSKLEYFKSLKEKFENGSKITSFFSAQITTLNRTLESSYEISLLIVKHGKNHSIGEELIEVAISSHLKTVLQKDYKDVRAMPLSNSTVCNRIDDVGQDVEKQLIEKMKSQKFSIQLDESTVWDSEALLLAYMRYIDQEEFQEEIRGMPGKIFSEGDIVMGRWPGSHLYYEVQVMGYNKNDQLYTVKYKDGTKLNLKENDIKSVSYFKPKKGSSRSNLRQRSRSRSRSPARSQTPKLSTSGGGESMKPMKKEEVPKEDASKLKPAPQVQENSTNNRTMYATDYQEKEKNKIVYRFVEPKAHKEIATDQLHLPYNLQAKREEAKFKDLKAKDSCLYVKKQVVQIQKQGFGARVGAAFMIFLLPASLILLLLMSSQNDPSILNFPPPLPALHTLWNGTTLGIFVLWFLFQALLYLLPIGKVVEGMPLANGKTLKYRINAFYAFLVCTVALGVALYNEVNLGYIHGHLLQLAVSAILFASVLSVYLYVRSWRVPADELAPGGNSGSFVYDFFNGRELNPRIRNFDLKYFCELRPGLMGWVVMNLGLLFAEMKLQNREVPSLAMILVNCFQLIYVLDALWNEAGILTTIDIVHEGFGYMLAFGDLVWVPFVYSLQAFYLVHHPNELSWPLAWAIIALNTVGYIIFRAANSQKNAFRRDPRHPKLAHLKTIPTATGKSLIVSGWWGFVRHPNYLGDLIMALAWSLPCGFNHILPYFYVLYFTCLLIHREARDEQQCRRKYGVAWDRYCQQVPYRIMPYIY
ncbi:delta(14)-sterol reductase LBR-like isoform X2 [Narcine bancroftii]|uniref:delta(14)-sterol reductase LBR-like isoform X2 n=1 Tax=Narcine bancroftii TaxID=1343680 RepID=UPI0038311638